LKGLIGKVILGIKILGHSIIGGRLDIWKVEGKGIYYYSLIDKGGV